VLTNLNSFSNKVVTRTTKLMGNRFEFTVAGMEEERAEKIIDEAIDEVKRIEKLLTTFHPDSQTNLVNRNAGIKRVPVDREMFELIQRSIKISHLTDGAFDLTYGSVDKSLWNFDVSMTSLPDTETARESVRLINYRNIILDEKACTVFLKEKEMRIGFGGIGKGYAAECARRLMKSRGVKSGIVNAAGDLTTWGLRPDGRQWTIGVVDPDHTNKIFASIDGTDMSVATSGNYEKYAIIDGKKYSHTIDPHTGLPVTGIKSVTIICPNAELADALATPVMIMGIKTGLHMINQMKNIGCIIVDDENRIYTSSNIHLHEEILQPA
jgi:thiamine biosynthesis lipoprotein